MKLHKFLLTPPIFAISVALFCGALFAEDKNTFEGTVDSDWFNRDNWSLGHVPQADEAVVIDGKTVVAQGGFTVGSLTLSGTAKLTIKANELTDYTVFETVEKATAAIRKAACIVTIAGNFEVGDTAIVYPEAAMLTGVPVIFRVGGNFTLAEGASFNATQRGWGWSDGLWKDKPSTYCKPRKCEGNDIQANGWTLAFGSGLSYGTGGNYGGSRSATSFQGKSYAQKYGTDFAPWLPGSPSGNYKADVFGKATGRGPGSIVVLAEGAAQVNGQMIANGNANDHAGTSGGGIWLAASSFSFGTGTSLSACGGNSGNNSAYGTGCGGRIALAEDCTVEELDAMLAGTLPETVLMAEGIDCVEAKVKGGQNPATKAYGYAGTCATVRPKTRQATMTVTSNVSGLVAEGVIWGDSVLTNGTYTFSAPAEAVLATDPGVKYTCTGYVVSNATGQVAADAALTVDVTINGRVGPYSLTWRYENPVAKVGVTFDGAGSVTVGGTTYNSDFETFVSMEDGATFVAAGTGESRFVSWMGGLIPGGVSEEAEIAICPTASGALTVTFVEGAIRRVWVGPKSGNVREPTNWNPAGIPTSQDELYLTNATVTVTGAWALKKLVVAGKSSVTFQAVTAAGTDPVTFDEIYAGATVVQIADDFEISGTATVTAANDPKTGVAVRFEVGGDFSVAEGATFTADGKGWYWYAGNDDPARTKVQGDAASGYWQTRAPGAGGHTVASSAYTRGGGYGGAGGGSDGNWGKTYGYAAAPFLPGSPNGMYGWIASRAMHPGGTLWVRCAGTVTVEGKVTTDGEKKDTFGDGSGGGIWLMAQDFVFGAQALLSAHGGDSSGNSYSNAGGGGRIALGLGLSDEEITALAGGEEDVEGVRIYNKIPVVETVLRPGLHLNGSGNGGSSGTARLVVGAACAPVVVDGVPLQSLGTSPRYGIYGYADGETVTLTAEAYGYNPTDDSVRYAFDGYVVSNTTEEVDSGVERSVEVTAGLELQKLIWKWGAPQPSAVIRKPAHAKLIVNGQDSAGDFLAWVEPGVTFTVKVEADDGYEFLNWTAAVPFGEETSNPITFAFTQTSEVEPIVRLAEAPTTRTWGGGTGSWNDPAAWTPKGNIPGPGDDVVIASGTCNVPNYLAAGSLTVSGGTLNVGPDKANSARLAVSGDMTLTGGTVNFGVENVEGHVLADIGGSLALSGKAKLSVYGGVIEGEYTHATGTSWVNVGGALTLDGTSVIYPVSSAYTGGSVVFKADTATVGATASLNADQAGYRWLDGSTAPLAPGLGNSYQIGGGYGGAGGGANATYGKTYGFAMAPVQPGSPNGNHGADIGNCYKPGGLIRIHARTMAIAGTLTANGRIIDDPKATQYGGASGGGIWLTADEFDFAETATLTAIGGNTGGGNGYWSQGGGGRIAVDTGLSDTQIAQLAETGKLRRKAYDEVAFTNAFLGVTINVNGGFEYTPTPPAKGKKGTFVYLPKPPGLMLLVK